MLDGNEHFTKLLKCMVENECMPKYENDGLCLATDEQALQDLKDIEQVAGDWWVLKGQNCGQDEVWRGAYDWYPCQHGRFAKVEDGSWINNTTYCNGKDSVCTSDTIVTIPKLSMVAPGVVRHDYPEGEAPIVPQVVKNTINKIKVESSIKNILRLKIGNLWQYLIQIGHLSSGVDPTLSLITMELLLSLDSRA
jgi:hypothetical protein